MAAFKKKVKITSEFTWFFEGVNPHVIPIGTIVEGDIAKNALAAKMGEEVPDDTPVTNFAPFVSPSALENADPDGEVTGRDTKNDEGEEKMIGGPPLNKGKKK